MPGTSFIDLIAVIAAAAALTLMAVVGSYRLTSTRPG